MMSTESASKVPNADRHGRGIGGCQCSCPGGIRCNSTASRDGRVSCCRRRTRAHRRKRAHRRSHPIHAQHVASGTCRVRRKLRHRDVRRQRGQEFARRAVRIVRTRAMRTRAMRTRAVRVAVMDRSFALAPARVRMRVPARRGGTLRVRVARVVRRMLGRGGHVQRPQSGGTHRHHKGGSKGRKDGPGPVHGSSSVGRVAARPAHGPPCPPHHAPGPATAPRCSAGAG
jgi:hypothetical protein